jgi:hypothetical protein
VHDYNMEPKFVKPSWWTEEQAPYHHPTTPVL